MRGIAVALVLLGVSSSCASGSLAPSATTKLQAAATATAHAKSFTVLLPGAEITYQAPDRVQQVEHGQASAVSSSSGGTTGSTSGPFGETITKVFVSGHFYEADTPAGQTPVYPVSARCVGQRNAADYVLGILRALATSSDIQASGDRFAFHIPRNVAVPFPIRGTATVRSGFVDSISVSPGSNTPPAMTIGSINAAPPVTAPRSSTPSNSTCNQ